MSNATLNPTSVLDVPVVSVVGQAALFPGLNTPADHEAADRKTRIAVLDAQVNKLARLFTNQARIAGVRANVGSNHDDTKIQVTVRGGLSQFTDTATVAEFLATNVVPYVADVAPEIWCVVDYERDGCTDWAAGHYTAGMTHEEFVGALAW